MRITPFAFLLPPDAQLAPIYALIAPPERRLHHPGSRFFRFVSRVCDPLGWRASSSPRPTTQPATMVHRRAYTVHGPAHTPIPAIRTSPRMCTTQPRPRLTFPNPSSQHVPDHLPATHSFLPTVYYCSLNPTAACYFPYTCADTVPVGVSPPTSLPVVSSPVPPIHVAVSQVAESAA